MWCVRVKNAEDIVDRFHRRTVRPEQWERGADGLLGDPACGRGEGGERL